MRADFNKCGEIFAANATLRSLYPWNGTIVGIDRNDTTLVSRAGCLAVCGSGPDLYSWKEVSSTITTWILPVIGTLLQAPFESNATVRTLLAISRWVGSPIASLSYVLWNIKVSAKAALMVDMAVKYHETPERRTDFGSMRDSMYLLLVMNQYTIKSTAALSGKEAEGLLRIVLFSRDLVLRPTDTDKSLRQMRRIMTRELRETRRRGAVPVFVSTMWFLFAFALSIQAAFGDLGQNTTAHDLALGCLLAWFPILIMGSIVDRNPIASEAIRKKLNVLVDYVRHALEDEQNREEFINTFEGQPDFDQLKTRVNKVAKKSEHMNDFFVAFAGQARVRWHYGVAHPILSDIENCYIADKGRNWLANEKEARSSLVLGPVNDEGLVWFDVREFWQVASAVIIVGGSCGGAFILSYFTPTVGLGCRSGGYTIFFCVTFGLLVVEMIVWLVLSPYEVDSPFLARTSTRLHSIDTFNRLEDDAHTKWRALKRTASGFATTTRNWLFNLIVRTAMIFPSRNPNARQDRVQSLLDNGLERFRRMSAQRKWEVFFFRPIETFNTIWLIYIVLAQVFGWYKTCACITSTWGGGGGYVDFGVQNTSNSKWVLWYWTAGTVLTALVMGVSMIYITVEWCQQSFLSTEEYDDAMSGLRKTRKYRSGTFFVRAISRALSDAILSPLEKRAVKSGFVKTQQKTLLWTRKHEWDPEILIPPSAPTPQPSYANPSPSFELRVFSDPQETPLMPHSPFDPTATTRTRNESDASLNPLSPYSPIRKSEDSGQPLIKRPSGAYHQRNDSDRSESRVSFEEQAFSSSPPDETGWSGASSSRTVYSRQGYQRTYSDPRMPPTEMMQSGRKDALGIHRDLERGDG